MAGKVINPGEKLPEAEPDVCPVCEVEHITTPKNHHELLIYWNARVEQAKVAVNEANALLRDAESGLNTIQQHGAKGGYSGSTKAGKR